MIPAARSVAWAGAIAATLALALLCPHAITDGDSCIYAAMSHDMAQAGSWIAPVWDFYGRRECFHEQPPGALWLSAFIECVGAPPSTAALAANALWTFAALAGVIAIAKLFVSRAAAHLAGLAFLLHVGVMHYVQRSALEIPFAASAAWTVAAGLRLARSRWWIAATTAALTEAFLIRGVFGTVPLGLLVYASFENRLRPPIDRLVVAVVGATALLVAFDCAHLARTGHSFWRAHFERVVLPSLQPGGTEHSIVGETWTYYAGRAFLYTLPWSMLPVARLVLGPRSVQSPAAWRLAAVWILVTVMGASTTSRENSRYLFQIYVATSLLVALAIHTYLNTSTARFASSLVLVVIPVQVALKYSFAERDAWWATASILERHREDPALSGRTIRGSFKPAHDRMKSMLRFHLGLWVSSQSDGSTRALEWIVATDPGLSKKRVVIATPLGVLVDDD